jgi:hypothetical protein
MVSRLDNSLHLFLHDGAGIIRVLRPAIAVWVSLSPGSSESLQYQSLQIIKDCPPAFRMRVIRARCRAQA